MLILINPITDPRDFDTIVIAGMESPGKCVITSPTRSYAWDVKTGKGAFGSTTTFTGRVPAKFGIEFTFWRKSHFEKWETLYTKLRYDPTKIKYNPATRWVSGVSPLDIFHAASDQLDINTVVVEEIGGLVHKGKGVWTTSVKFIEYYPPPKISVVSTPAGDTPVSGLPPNLKIAERQSQLGDLVKQLGKVYP
mgnify:CR=1 FL=1